MFIKLFYSFMYRPLSLNWSSAKKTPTVIHNSKYSKSFKEHKNIHNVFNIIYISNQSMEPK